MLKGGADICAAEAFSLATPPPKPYVPRSLAQGGGNAQQAICWFGGT